MSRLLFTFAVGAMLALPSASHAQLNLSAEPLGVDLAGSRCVFTVKTLPLTGENPDKRALDSLRESLEQPKAVVGASLGMAVTLGSEVTPQGFTEAMMVVLTNMQQAETRPDPFSRLEGAVQIATGEPEYQGKLLDVVRGLPAFGAISELNTPDASYNRLCN